MNWLLRFSGIFGAILLIFGFIGGLVIRSFVEPLVLVHLVLGVAGVVAWFATSGLRSGSTGRALTGRTARFSYNAVLYSSVFVGILIVINMLAVWNDKRWDMTEKGVYSLTDGSVSLLKSLKKPLKLIAVDVPGAGGDRKPDELLKLYKYHNPALVSFEILEPRSKVLEVQKLGLKQGNLMYIQYGDAQESGISRINEITEEGITNAALKLVRGEAKKIYFVQGHGEPDMQSAEEGGLKQFTDTLKDEHLNLEGLLLLQTGKVPEDASAVVLIAPKKTFSEPERQALIAYVEKGGRLIMMNDGELRQESEVGVLAKHFGIEVGKDIVIDQQLRVFSGPTLAVEFLAQNFETHPITKRLSKTEPPVFAFSSSVRPTGVNGDNVSYLEVVKSGPNSWAEKNVALAFDPEAGTATLEPDDIKGPVSVAVVYEKKLDQPKAGEKGGQPSFETAARVLVFGDDSWVTNGRLSMTSNRELAVGSVAWSVGEEGGVSVEPKTIRSSSAAITQSTFNYILAVSFLVPELILLLGLLVWWRRRTVSV